jgi:hypothetical protein
VEQFETFNNKIPYMFRLPGVISESTKQQESITLNNIISRNIGDLRKFYQKYADITGSVRGNEKVHVITRSVLWQILKESEILKYGYSLGID